MVGSMQIEERAREYAEKSFAQRIKIPEEEITERQKSRIMNGYVAVYTKIATEQKAIDDANTIMLIQEQKELSLALIEKQKAIDIDKACEWLRSNYADAEYSPFLVKFRKAMEGEK